MFHSGAALLSVNNAVNTVSRIAMGFIADYAGRQNTLVLSVLGSAVTVVAFWLPSAYGDDMRLWITFVVTYGVFAGGKLVFLAILMSIDIAIKATTPSSQPRSSKCLVLRHTHQ